VASDLRVDAAEFIPVGFADAQVEVVLQELAQQGVSTPCVPVPGDRVSDDGVVGPSPEEHSTATPHDSKIVSDSQVHYAQGEDLRVEVIVVVGDDGEAKASIGHGSWQGADVEVQGDDSLPVKQPVQQPREADAAMSAVDVSVGGRDGGVGNVVEVPEVIVATCLGFFQAPPRSEAEPCRRTAAKNNRLNVVTNLLGELDNRQQALRDEEAVLRARLASIQSRQSSGGVPS